MLGLDIALKWIRIRGTGDNFSLGFSNELGAGTSRPLFGPFHVGTVGTVR